jgi:hypothetical protein
LHNAELPKLDRKKYDASLELARQAAMAPTKEVVEAEEEDEDLQDTKQGN